jgi:hypothetical protein
VRGSSFGEQRIYGLDFGEEILNVCFLFQIGLEDGWRGCTGETLTDHQHAGMLKGAKDLTAEQTSGTGDQNVGSHGDGYLGVERRGEKAP